jgi:hypothetical protein
MSEAELQKAVIELARRLGWRTAHFRPGMTQTGRWVTAVQGDGKGFPDLVLAKNGVVLFVELKAKVGRISKEQEEWLWELPHDHSFVWRPEHWADGEIEETLRDFGGARAAA